MMTPLRKIGFVLTLLIGAARSVRADATTIGWIGPMLHWNFGPDRTRLSLGVEASHWHIFNRFPLGVDYGVEWEVGGKWRTYAEGEFGVIAAGVGAGPVLEWGAGRLGWGIQTTLWANFLVGIDYRVREYGTLSRVGAAGLYAKKPIYGDYPRQPFLED